MSKSEKKPKKYWYKFYYEECVLCGNHKEHKERQYTKRPKDGSKRVEFSQFACGEHFF